MDNDPTIDPSCLRDIIVLLSPFASQPSQSIAHSIDWRQAYKFCDFHGVRPRLARVLEEQGEAYRCPAWLTDKLADFSKRHAFSVLAKTADIVSIAEALESASITGIFFKGAVLGEQVYGGSNVREFNDIDLLVSAGERERTADIFSSLGYHPIIADYDIRHTFFDYMGQHMFRHVETGSVVDLHWNFVGSNPFPIDGRGALRNRVTLELGGAAIPAPCIEDLCLILAGHGHKEGWASFTWALDFAMFAAKFPDFDWANAAARSEAKRSMRPLLSAMLLVDRLFDHAIDHKLLTIARGKSEIVDDVERVVARYHAFTRRTLADDLMGSFRLCETAPQRAVVWLRLFTTRTIGDYEAAPLPPRWWWAYRFTRPLRLVWHRIRGGTPAPSAFWDAQRDN